LVGFLKWGPLGEVNPLGLTGNQLNWVRPWGKFREGICKFRAPEEFFFKRGGNPMEGNSR